MQMEADHSSPGIKFDFVTGGQEVKLAFLSEFFLFLHVSRYFVSALVNVSLL